MNAEIAPEGIVPSLPPDDPMAGRHTSVVIQWAGNPPQYVLHVNSALDAEALSEFLIHELKRIAKALRADPITADDTSDIQVDDLAASIVETIEQPSVLATDLASALSVVE